MARDFCHGYILYFAPIFSKGWFRSWNHIKRYFLCEYFSPSRIKTPKFIENQSSQKPKFNFVDAYNNITILLGPLFSAWENLHAVIVHKRLLNENKVHTCKLYKSYDITWIIHVWEKRHFIKMYKKKVQENTAGFGALVWLPDWLIFNGAPSWRDQFEIPPSKISSMKFRSFGTLTK